ncbi:MAG: hypothetical protein HY901_25100 [Deltaproteobacteria bacterium]|nr:hypothetical protein [Deltaproteobacteria bacterium]
MRRLLLLASILSLAGCAHDSSLAARDATAAQLAREAEDGLKEADGLLKAGTDLDKVAELLQEARSRVEDRGMVFYADRENLEDRLSQADSRLVAARDTKLRREIAAQIPERKEKCEALLVEFRSAADALQDRATLDRPKAQSARQALEAATRFLDDSKPLGIDASWTAYATGARKELAGRTVQVTLAEAVLSFYEGPVAKNAEAKGLLEQGKASKQPEERTSLVIRARDAWQSCATDAAALIAQAPALEREPLKLPGTRATAKSFAAACESQAKSAEAVLNPPAAKPGKAAKATKPPAKKR